MSAVHSQDMKHLGSLESTQEAMLEAMPRATFMHLLCSSNFLCASYLNECMPMYEPIVKYNIITMFEKFPLPIIVIHLHLHLIY